jgi:hypothetical protein
MAGYAFQIVSGYPNTWYWNQPQVNWGCPDVTITGAYYNNPVTYTGGPITNAISYNIGVSATISGATLSNTTPTYFVNGANPFVVGQVVTTKNIVSTSGSLNTTATVTRVTASSFTTSATISGDSYISGGFAYGQSVVNINRITVSGSSSPYTITFNTAGSYANPFVVGEPIGVFETSPTIFSNDWVVTSVTASSFSVQSTSSAFAGISGSGGFATSYGGAQYICNNNFIPGQLVTVTGIRGNAGSGTNFNIVAQPITSCTASSFYVAYNNYVTDLYVSGGNPSISPTVTYLGSNNFVVGQTVVITGTTPNDYNQNQQIVGTTSGSFQLFPTSVPSSGYSSGGIASVFPVNGDFVDFYGLSAPVTTSGNINLGNGGISIYNNSSLSLSGSYIGNLYLDTNGNFTTNNNNCTFSTLTANNLSTINFGSSNIVINGGPTSSGDLAPTIAINGSVTSQYSAGASVVLSNTLPYGSVISYNGTSTTLPPITYSGQGPLYFYDATGTGSTFPLSNLTFSPTLSTTTTGNNLIISSGSNLVINGLFTVSGINQFANGVGHIPTYIASDQSVVNTPTWSYTPATITASSLAIKYAIFQNIKASGVASWSSPDATGWGDGGGNSGITFSPSISGYFYNAAVTSGNWSDAKWYASTSGNSGVVRNPLPQDIAVFDKNSAKSNATIKVDQTIVPGFNAATFTGTLNFFNSNYYIFSSISLGSKVTGTSTWYLLGSNVNTITSNGYKWPRATYVDLYPGSTVTLQDNFSTAANLTVNIGTLSANNPNVNSIVLQNFTVSTGSKVVMGNQLWTVSGTWTFKNTSSGALTPNFGSIQLANPGTTNFYGGNQSYYSLTLPYSQSAGTYSTIAINDSNSFNNFIGPRTLTYPSPSPLQQTNGFSCTVNFTGNNTFNSLTIYPMTNVGFQGTKQTINYLNVKSFRVYGAIFDSFNTSLASSASQYQTNGDVDSRTFINPVSWQPATATAIIKDGTGSDGWTLGLNPSTGNNLGLYFSYKTSSGTTETVSGILSIGSTPANAGWVGVTRSQNTGAVAFNYSPDPGNGNSPATWAYSRSVASTSGSISMGQKPTITVGSNNFGQFLRAQVYNGISGYNPSPYYIGISVSVSGATYTVNSGVYTYTYQLVSPLTSNSDFHNGATVTITKFSGGVNPNSSPYNGTYVINSTVVSGSTTFSVIGSGIPTATIGTISGDLANSYASASTVTSLWPSTSSSSGTSTQPPSGTYVGPVLDLNFTTVPFGTYTINESSAYGAVWYPIPNYDGALIINGGTFSVASVATMNYVVLNGITASGNPIYALNSTLKGTNNNVLTSNFPMYYTQRLG